MGLDFREAGPFSQIASLGRELGIIKPANETICWDEKQRQMEPGFHTLTMFIGIHLGRRPLYLRKKN